VSARTLRTALFAALALVLCLAAPAAATDTVRAAGGSASAALPAASATPSSIEVQFWPSETDGAVLVVGAELPAQTALPATIRLPLPAGATVTWVGEVFGGDPNADTEVPYAEEKGEGGQVLIVTLTKSRSAQYEANLPAPTEIDGRRTASFTWVQSASGPEVGLSVKMASTTGDIVIEPGSRGAPPVNATGERLYTLPAAKLALGKSATVKASWVTAAPGAAGTSSAGSSTVLYVLVGLLAIALIALAVVMVSRAGARG
jgi:hypothetical protein